MITPKPLSKEELTLVRNGRLNDADTYYLDGFIIDKLAAAEAFWRETVKKSACWHINTELNMKSTSCLYCHVFKPGTLPLALKDQHEADCPWLLAQET